MILEYEYMQSKDDLREINKFTLLKRYPLWLIGMAVFGFCNLRIGINGLRFGGDTFISLLYLFMAYVALIQFPVGVVRGMKRIENMVDMQDTVRLFIDDSIFRAESMEHSFECTYENFQRVFETDKYFFLMLPIRGKYQPLYFIRKSDITPEMSQKLNGFFSDRLGKKFRRK